MYNGGGVEAPEYQLIKLNIEYSGHALIVEMVEAPLKI